MLNLQSLEKYQQLELEKKKTRVVKKAPSGPMIHYLSTTMPLIEELGQDGDRINVEEEEDAPAPSTEPAPSDSKQRCERTFITFPNENVLESYINQSKVNPPKKNICPITRSAPFMLFSPIV